MHRQPPIQQQPFAECGLHTRELYRENFTDAAHSVGIGTCGTIASTRRCVTLVNFCHGSIICHPGQTTPNEESLNPQPTFLEHPASRHTYGDILKQFAGWAPQGEPNPRNTNDTQLNILPAARGARTYGATRGIATTDHPRADNQTTCIPMQHTCPKIIQSCFRNPMTTSSTALPTKRTSMTSMIGHTSLDAPSSTQN